MGLNSAKTRSSAGIFLPSFFVSASFSRLGYTNLGVASYAIILVSGIGGSHLISLVFFSGAVRMDSYAQKSGQHRRVLLKLSGESFCRIGERGISMAEVTHIATQVAQAKQQGTEIAIVIGGGNILRGSQFAAGSSSIHEATAHYMGMLATVLNGLALQDAIESIGAQCR